MYPANPPLPMPRNFPFQPLAGIQTSTLMSESGVGFSVTATRQKAGADVKTGGTFSSGLRPGGTNAAAAMGAAEVIVALGRFSCIRLAHERTGASAAVGQVRLRMAASLAEHFGSDKRVLRAERWPVA